MEQLIRDQQGALIEMESRIVEALTTNQQNILREFTDVKGTLGEILHAVSQPQVEEKPRLSKKAVEILCAAVEGDGEIAVLDHPGMSGALVNPRNQKIGFDGRFYVDAVMELEDAGFVRHSGGQLWVTTPTGHEIGESLKDTEGTGP